MVGCQEGKNTPKLTEIVCPQCGAIMEVFVYMGGAVGHTGYLASDEKCPKCGFAAKEGQHIDEFEMA